MLAERRTLGEAGGLQTSDMVEFAAIMLPLTLQVSAWASVFFVLRIWTSLF